MLHRKNRPLSTGLVSLIAIATLIGLPAIAQQSAADAALPGQVTYSSDVVNQDIKAKDKPAMSAKGKAVGDLVISLQPPGAKQFVVDLFGEADKLVLNYHNWLAGLERGIPCRSPRRGSPTPGHCSRPAHAC